jgi:hypothetical protein
MSSMLPSRAIIPATRHSNFTWVHPARTAEPDQARLRHQMRVIKRRMDLRQPMQHRIFARCPLQLDDGSVRNSHRPSSEATFRVGTAEHAPIYAAD